MDKIIEVSDLKKSYGTVEAVKGIDFYVERGKLFAFLGPNGAGKTTTINIISTLLGRDAGDVRVNGHVLGKDDASIRGDIGIVFQDSVLDDLLTVEENLWTRGSFYGLSDDELKENVQAALAATNITDLRKRRYKSLSGGQRRRADIARALLHHPKILFLDEPTTGLDPQTRKSVWNTIIELQHKHNMTIFLTTHYMEEADHADYVIVIDEGEIAAKGTPTQLKNTYSGDLLIAEPNDAEAVKQFFEDEGLDYVVANDTLRVTIETTKDAIDILNAIRDKLDSFEVRHGTMDDAFIGITGKEMRE